MLAILFQEEPKSELQYEEYIYYQIWLEYLLSVQSRKSQKLYLSMLQITVNQT